MLRVKIKTPSQTYIVENVTCYLNASDVLYAELKSQPEILEICNLDENNEELEVVTLEHQRN